MGSISKHYYSPCCIKHDQLISKALRQLHKWVAEAYRRMTHTRGLSWYSKEPPDQQPPMCPPLSPLERPLHCLVFSTWCLLNLTLTLTVTLLLSLIEPSPKCNTDLHLTHTCSWALTSALQGDLRLVSLLPWLHLWLNSIPS